MTHPPRRRAEPAGRLSRGARRPDHRSDARAPAARRCSSASRSSCTDILTDPLWEDYRDVARHFGLRACWSTPIFSPQRKVLGSLAMYYDRAAAPQRRGIAADRDRSRHRAHRHRAAAGPPGAAAQRGTQPGHPAGDSRLDVPDHGRRRLPRLHARDAVEAARPAIAHSSAGSITDVLPPPIADALAQAFARAERVRRGREGRVHARGPATTSGSSKPASSAATATRS